MGGRLSIENLLGTIQLHVIYERTLKKTLCNLTKVILVVVRV